MGIGRTVGLSGALVAAACGLALAQTPSAHRAGAHRGSASGQAKLSKMDSDFLLRANNINQAEIALAHIAGKKVRSENGKWDKFADRMVLDHGKAERALHDLAMSLHFYLPTRPGAKQQTMANKLNGLNGAAFASGYGQAQVQGHEQAVVLFKDEIRNGRNPQVKAYARKFLPVIEQHLQMAQANMGGGMAMHRSANSRARK